MTPYDDPNALKYGPLPPRPPETLLDDFKWFFEIIVFGLLRTITWPIQLIWMFVEWLLNRQEKTPETASDVSLLNSGKSSGERPSAQEELQCRLIRLENESNEQTEQTKRNVFLVNSALRWGCWPMILITIFIVLASSSAVAFFR